MKMSSYKASSVFNLPQRTLQRYVKDRQESSSEAITPNRVGSKFVTCEGEHDLAEHCLLMERTFLSLTMADVMRLAYQLAIMNGIKNQFCTRNEKTGKKWLKIFLRRHQEISVTTHEVLHSQKQGVSLLSQQRSIFKSANPLHTPFVIILQHFTISSKPASQLHSINTRKY